MMKKILIICFIIFFPFKLYGKYFINKGLICENFQKGYNLTPIIGFWFEKDNKVSFFQKFKEGWFDLIKGTYKLNDFNISIVLDLPINKSNKNLIYIGNFSIDRNTGKLKHISFEFICDEIWNNKINLRVGLDKRLETLLDKKREQKRKKEKDYQDKLNKRKF